MAATRTPAVPPPGHFHPKLRPIRAMPPKPRLVVRRIEGQKNGSSPGADFFFDPYAADGSGYAADGSRSDSLRSSVPTWSSSPSSHSAPFSSSLDKDLEELGALPSSDFRQRSYRADAERRNRQWASGTWALLGGMLAMILAAYQLRFAAPVLKKVADSAVPTSSSRPYPSSSPSGAGAASSPGITGSLQETTANKVAARRQWLFGIFVLAFSIFSATFFARLHAWMFWMRRRLRLRIDDRLPQHSKVEKEIAELYSIDDESLGINGEVKTSGAVTAIRKCLSDYKALNRLTHQSAFAIFFHLAAQSRRRQIAYSVYRNACDALHAKVEQSRPVLNEEVAEVLRKQRSLRMQYERMIDDVVDILDKENLPPGLCEEELEYLTGDFRPALVELANHTIKSLDMDRRFFEAFIQSHHMIQTNSDEVTAAEGLQSKRTENTYTYDSQQEPQDERPLEAGDKGAPAEQLTTEEPSEESLHESQFWEARRALSTYRRDTFRPEVPDFDRCFLPELPLSLFAY
ncbi:hypothetical protein, conserved [Eimeria necatrix]|uniref:Transmembrane protein n=1 Tax=Eimeria necatrix TaxID=51315 RepID=U6MJV7_9EIME|nr:hypothetical protein, conserved [Eimeria necatrix]CDJ64301.1 hypothetical protein, conserved [Eimeria necatrix]